MHAVGLFNFCKAHRTPSISAPRNYVYKQVYIYFSAAGQARAVGSLESGNLMVYGPLNPQHNVVRRVAMPGTFKMDNL